MIYFQKEDDAVFARLQSSGRITHTLRRLIAQQWNKCSVCGFAISSGRPAFAGYDAQSGALFVGACCAHLLQELASPIYWHSSLDISVDDAQAVWRYMDFAKFMALLQRRGIYLSRADRFDDRFEGAIGVSARKADWDEYYLSHFRELIVTPPPGHPVPNHTQEEIEAEANRLLTSLKAFALDARQLLVSCWHGGDIEAEALWRLYCPPGTAGVAIQSTVGKLWDACAHHDQAKVGRVHYIDFRRNFASFQMDRIFQKRKSLSHEREVRIVLPNDRQSPIDGSILECDLEKLISKIVISPFAPAWLGEVISDALKRYDYSFDLKPSELLDEPFFG